MIKLLILLNNSDSGLNEKKTSAQNNDHEFNNSSLNDFYTAYTLEDHVKYMSTHTTMPMLLLL